MASNDNNKNNSHSMGEEGLDPLEGFVDDKSKTNGVASILNKKNLEKEDADVAEECATKDAPLMIAEEEEEEAPSFTVSDRSFDFEKDGLTAMSPAQSLKLDELSALSGEVSLSEFVEYVDNDLARLIAQETAESPTGTATTAGSNENKLAQIQIDAGKKVDVVLSVINRDSLVRRATESGSFIGMDQDSVNSIIDEYCKFLVCKGRALDTNAKYLSASGAVDEMWSLHMLDSVNYMAVCRIFGVLYMHKNPDESVDDEEDMKKRFNTTHLLYFKLFGRLPPPTAWDNVQITAFSVLTSEQDAVIGNDRTILIDCGHVDCKCDPKVGTKKIQFIIEEAQYSNLFWRDHTKEDHPQAYEASNQVLSGITDELGEAHASVLLDSLGMSKRRKKLFLRDAIPSYIDALIECPNHRVGLDGSEAITIFIKNVAKEATSELHVLSSFSILHVKVLIRSVLTKGRIPVANQTLLYSGHQLDDHLTLADYGIITTNQATIQLVTSA